MRTAPVESAAKRAGAAVIDRSPVARRVPRRPRSSSSSGIDAFERSSSTKRGSALEQRALARSIGPARAGLTQRAALRLVPVSRPGQERSRATATRAWDELVVANTIDPTRELDPAGSRRRSRSEFARVHEARWIASDGRSSPSRRRRAARVTVDGAAASAAPGRSCIVGRALGARGVRRSRAVGRARRADATEPCRSQPRARTAADRRRVARAGAHRRGARVRRRRGAREVATARLVGLDGRERDRRTRDDHAAISTPLADAVRELLTPTAKTALVRDRSGHGRPAVPRWPPQSLILVTADRRDHAEHHAVDLDGKPGLQAMAVAR